MEDLKPEIAERIIKIITQGIPPEYGFKYFTEGLEIYLSVIENEYLASYIKEGGSAFKMVIGSYGGGKTHFLYCVRDIAWKHNFVTSYVSLSPTECPFHSLDLVYKAICKNLTCPLTPEEILSGYEKGIISVLRSIFSLRYSQLRNQGFPEEEIYNDLVETINNIESISFSRAVKLALKSLLNNKENDFLDICQWLMGEGHIPRIRKEFGILQKIDKTTAPSMLRSLIQFIRAVGFSGLVILFDEAERIVSLSSKQKIQHLNNLREIIDRCGYTDFQGVMIFYAVPDENFLEGRANIYEALKQRLSTIFEEINPTGVKIVLEKIPEDPTNLLIKIGKKLKEIYQIAYKHHFDEELANKIIYQIAQDAYEERFGDIGYKRLFVQRCIKTFNIWKSKGKIPDLDEIKS